MFRFIACLFILPLLLVACAPTPQPAALIVNTPAPTPVPTSTPLATLDPALPAPRLVHRHPAYSHIDELQPVITLKFDRVMKAESVARALTVDPVLPISITAYGGLTLTVDLLAPFTPGGLYTFTLGTGATDLQGARLADEVIWTYSPKAFTALLTPPLGTSALPPFRINFTHPVNPASVERALWILPALPGTLGWNEDYTGLTFTPTVRYAADTLYVIRFDRAPLLDPSDQPLPLLAPVSFVSNSAIVRHSPASDGVVLSAAIRVEFDRPMDRASVEAAFHLSPTLPGEFTWQTNTLIFTPDEGALTEDTPYSVRLDPALRSADDEAVLNAEYGWSFHTASVKEPVAGFGYGPNTQILNADGPRAVQFEIYSARITDITFTLYALTQRQFLANYAQGHEAYYWDERPLTSTAELRRVGQWMEATTQAVEVEVYGETARLHETHLPLDVPPGFYLLEVSNRHANDQLFLSLTGHSLVIKQTSDEIVAWVTDFAGQPQAEAQVEAMAPGGWSVGECQTNAQGLCRLTPNPLNPPVVVLAHTPAGVALAGLGREWQQTGGARPAHYAVSVYTDQPAYHPGETINFKAIVRQDQDAALSVPPVGTVVTVRLQWGWGEPLRTIYLTTDEFGAVYSRFELDADLPLDEYYPPLISVGVSVGGEHFSETILLRDGAAAGYRVSLTTDASTYVIGDLMTITGQVQDAAGRPVAGARIHLAQYEPDYYGGNCWYPTCWNERDDTRLTGLTDLDGNVTFYVFAERLRSSSNLALELTATADGLSGSALALVRIQERDAALALTLPVGNVYAPGQTFEVGLSSRTLLDTAFPNVPVQLTLNGWDTTRQDYTTVLQSIEVTTDAEGRATVPVAVVEPGHYQLRLTGYDSRGQVIAAGRDVYILVEGAAWPAAGDRQPLRLIADHYEYAPGEAAGLWIESTMSGPALLTLERGTVRQAELITLTAPLTRIRLLLKAEDAPNVHVIVQAWQAVTETIHPDLRVSLAEARLQTAELNLPVRVVNKHLTLTLTPDQAAYAPGETATVQIRVTDANGAPVVAQLSLALVDEQAFALSPNAAASPWSAFYHQRSAQPSLYHSQRPNRAFFWDEMGGCGGEAAYSSLLSASFQAGAWWEPALVTDANGELTVTITLPDTLANWRLTAVAVTAETQVGEAALHLGE